MNENVNIILENTEISQNGLRKFSIGLFGSNRGRLTTNELPHILHAMKLSRYDILSQYTLHFEEEEHLYDPDNFHGTLTLVCKYGIDDITQALRQEDIVWERYSEDSNGEERAASDLAWNIRHSYENWPTGRKRLTLVHSDIDSVSDFPSMVVFRATVTIRDGHDDVIGQKLAEFEYTN